MVLFGFSSQGIGLDMELGEKYKNLYGGYYSEDGVAALSVKRQVTSDAAAAHFASFFSNPKFDTLIDTFWFL